MIPGEIIYVTERDTAQKLTCVGWYVYLTRVVNTVLAVHNSSTEVNTEYSKADLLTDLMYLTATEDLYPGIYAFPVRDCYQSLERAQQAFDIEKWKAGRDGE